MLVSSPVEPLYTAVVEQCVTGSGTVGETTHYTYNHHIKDMPIMYMPIMYMLCLFSISLRVHLPNIHTHTHRHNLN